MDNSVSIKSQRFDGLTLTAYYITSEFSMPIAAASAHRAWMDATDRHFANRCLPMLIANQTGWFVLASHSLRATWTGGEDATALQIQYLDGSPPYPAVSTFGAGILTWTLPYLFRTSPGYNLLVRGPANWPKDGVYPLEGTVESDWCAATFTMNWKLTRVNNAVTFEQDEPICMLVPQQRGELEAFRTVITDMESDLEVRQNYEQWAQSRRRFLSDLKDSASEAAKQGWQKHYFRGVSSSETVAPQHQTKLKLNEFDKSY